ncbi:MAG: alanine--tRNA ligase [Patescibacteria group bacterium]
MISTPKLTSVEVRTRFLAFFKERGHAIIPSSSLVPENDPSVLFNTAGMQPIVPYLLGEKHPEGTRLADIQKCVRTVDIEEVGDSRHLTFFEMMGNWSLGDYFKKEAIEWSYDLLTNAEYGFGLDPERLYVTCFEGDENAPKDTESAAIWKDVFKNAGVHKNDKSGTERIFFLPAKNNWWSPGDNGPCGPDTEMFYDTTGLLTQGLTHEEYVKADDEGKLVEIWNDVFMEYKKKDGVVIGKLDTQNVDTGSGFERIVMMVQGVSSVYETDVFVPILEKIETLRTAKDGVEAISTETAEQSKRIIADHIRTSVMLFADGVVPSNTDQGYILRRLLRRALRHADILGMPDNSLFMVADVVTDYFKEVYTQVGKQKETIKVAISAEEKKFRKALTLGLKEFNKIVEKTVTAGKSEIETEHVFTLFESYGFPIELVTELAHEKKLTIDTEGFKAMFAEHQEKSRAGSEKKFKGGMAGDSVTETRYHTATHLLHQALREVLGTHVSQKGSNITAERLRFDFSHTAKMTDEEKKLVEEKVNGWIADDLPVAVVIMPKDEAEKTGALHFFGEKYGDNVQVYFIGDTLDHAISKEFCGGPHVGHTGELGTFSIQKEEAVSQGVRRIKAILS